MPKTDQKRQWLPFDHLINDESLAELISPVVAASITRRADRAFFEYFGDELDLHRFREKEREWLARWHEENDPGLEAEREARFQAYLKSLNLDNTIEIPCTIIRNDGTKEASSYWRIADSQA